VDRNLDALVGARRFLAVAPSRGRGNARPGTFIQWGYKKVVEDVIPVGHDAMAFKVPQNSNTARIVRIHFVFL